MPCVVDALAAMAMDAGATKLVPEAGAVRKTVGAFADATVTVTEPDVADSPPLPIAFAVSV